DHAFQRCSSLEEIEIPENVEYIDSEAFLGCTGLRRVYMRSKHIRDDRWLPDELKDRVTIEYRM
ncbi:MAG: leucine-rich repeat protein, partial [Clostridia bacterium]|nr:leucine-rich repeat protein [Clostridia bacterium]